MATKRLILFKNAPLDEYLNILKTNYHFKKLLTSQNNKKLIILI